MYIDISVPINSELPIWPGNPEVNIKKNLSLYAGDIANDSSINMSLHTGTHIDAPSHFIPNGKSINEILISRLIGPVYVCSIKNTNIITAPMLQNCQIPDNAKRLLLKTDNSQLWVNKQSAFYEDFTALSPDAANWIVDREIELIGIDYLSIQKYNDKPDVHIILLKNEVVILEGLDLSAVTKGLYELICLPLKLENVEASPARVFIKRIS